MYGLCLIYLLVWSVFYLFACMVCVLFICVNGLCLQDHDAHGPEFLKHMNRINSSTGAHLSVSFYDTFRVNVFKYFAIFCRLITHYKIGT